MDHVRRYEVEGIVLDIPLRYDERYGIFIEEYPDFSDEPVWTREGRPVMFMGEDACEFAQADHSEHIRDCGGCRHYLPVGRYALIGICRHDRKRHPKHIGKEVVEL